MPIIKSAKKALRQSLKRRLRNIGRKEAIKNAVAKIKKAKKEEALKLLSLAYKAVDKAAKAGIIKKNAAARKKSRLAKLINKF